MKPAQLWLVSIKDKSVDEEQVIGWAIIEAPDEKAARDMVDAKIDEVSMRLNHYRLTVARMEPFEIGKWLRPHVICNRRHRGPDGSFPS